jgi:hypothetical protein
MLGIEALEAWVAEPGEPEDLFAPLAPAPIDGIGRLEAAILGMETEDPEDALGLREVALDHALQVRDAPEAPVLEIFTTEQAHADEDLDRRDHLTGGQDLIDGADDAIVVGVLAVGSLGDFPHTGQAPMSQRAR